jgi:hypothetical protein
MMLEFCAL